MISSFQSVSTQTEQNLSLLRKEVIHPHVPRRDTLLRLHPNHQSHLRSSSFLSVRPPASGVINSHGVTGSVQARERIHRGILIRNLSRFQLRAVELQTAVRTENGFPGFRSGSLLRFPLFRPL